MPNLSNILERTPTKSVKIPAMVAAELTYGAEKSNRREKNLEKIKLFLSVYGIVPFDEKASVMYGEIRADLERRGTVISGNDMVIAAIVLASGGTLVTHNIAEFSRVKRLSIEDWV